MKETHSVGVAHFSHLKTLVHPFPQLDIFTNALETQARASKIYECEKDEIQLHAIYVDAREKSNRHRGVKSNEQDVDVKFHHAVWLLIDDVIEKFTLSYPGGVCANFAAIALTREGVRSRSCDEQDGGVRIVLDLEQFGIHTTTPGMLSSDKLFLTDVTLIVKINNVRVCAVLDVKFTKKPR